LLQLLEHLGARSVQIVQVVAAHGELILRGAVAAADAHVLRSLQVQRGAGHPRQFGPQPRDDVVGRDFALASGFSEMNMRPVLVDPPPPPPPPVKPFTVSTAGSAATMFTIWQQDLVHGLKRGVLVGQNLPDHAAVVLLREESLGHANEQVNVQPMVASRTSSVIGAMAQHDGERLSVEVRPPS
jgi:hypothetical protein